LTQNNGTPLPKHEDIQLVQSRKSDYCQYPMAHHFRFLCDGLYSENSQI